MANWCSNNVTFNGEISKMDELGKLLTGMAEKEEETKEGQLPPFGDCEGGWLFDIYWWDGVLNYETKWAPNLPVLIAIAEHFKVGFECNYNEPGNFVYGEASYTDGVLTEVALDWGDTASYEFDEETDTYRFENQKYENNEEILEILLERKKAKIKADDLNSDINNI